MVTEIQTVIACEGWRLYAKRHEGTFWVMNMFYILPTVLFSWIYTFIKTHQIVHLRSVPCIIHNVALK